MRLLKIMYFAIHERMPPSIADRLFEVWSKTFIRRFLRKRRAARMKAAKTLATSTHGKVASTELARFLHESGIAEGDILFFQCSFNDLYTFDGSPLALIQLLRNLIGTCVYAGINRVPDVPIKLRSNWINASGEPSKV